MQIQEQIKEELLKEIGTNIDNIYDFMHTRYNMDKCCTDTMINELKDVIYKVSQLSGLN